ncbi:MAG: tRNA 2-selenouridine(34) synthase MnmH [Rhodoferax sp.]|nr:tRNA 2-selenouridine(34) synthase MnmH [Rhodoferax sp.]
MSLSPVDAVDLLRRLDEFDAVIDARSEDEYALDHLPGAVNWPTLDNEQRHVVGTTYKQVNPFEARKMGAAMAARNIARHIEERAFDKPRSWRPLVYCWRGGQRSGSLSLVLDQIGFRVHIVQGGYKAFRAALVADTEHLAEKFEYQVVCGTTGSGKTRLLHALGRAGAQVLDLEALAHHRSSVLGAIPGLPQPSQKAFDTRVWDVLRRLDPARPVFVESESRKVGNVAVPIALMEAMRSRGHCLNLVLPDTERVALLMEDYDFFVRDTEAFCARLDALTEIRGKAVVQAWKSAVREGRLASVVQDLLTQHYDPVYLQSMQRNFRNFGTARTLSPADHSAQAMDALAATMELGRFAQPQTA